MQKSGLLQYFITSIWSKPEHFPERVFKVFPTKLKRGLARFYSKRSHRDIHSQNVRQIWGAEVFRLITDIITRGNFRRELLFFQKMKYDAHVAKLIPQLKPDIFVGYEISCRRSFAAARNIGATTILDLASLDHRFSNKALAHLKQDKKSKKIQHKLSVQKKAELKLTDHIFCLSQLAKETLVKQGFAENNIHVFHLGTNLDVFKLNPQIKKSGKFSVIYVGNISRAKGVDILISAIKKLGSSDIELILVGSPADIPRSELNLGFIQTLGFLSAEQLADEFRKSDIFVLPSLVDGWGLVVPEAMACGIPVIVSNHCGSAELVTKNTGWIVQAGNENDLAKALQEAYNNRAALPKMGRLSAKTVEKKTWAAYEKNIANCTLKISGTVH